MLNVTSRHMQELSTLAVLGTSVGKSTHCANVNVRRLLGHTRIFKWTRYSNVAGGLCTSSFISSYHVKSEFVFFVPDISDIANLSKLADNCW